MNKEKLRVDLSKALGRGDESEFDRIFKLLHPELDGDDDDYFDYREEMCDPYEAMDEVMLSMQNATCECGSTEQKVDYVIEHNQSWFVRSCASCNKEIYRYLD
jgi:hypothetical protein